jgi:BON domain
MRQLLLGLVVAATTVFYPMMATAGNQDTADLIASNLKAGADLQECKINVKVVDNKAWLNGSAATEEQLGAIFKIASETKGVEKVYNRITIKETEKAAPKKAEPKSLLAAVKKIGVAQKPNKARPSVVRQASAMSDEMVPMPPQPMAAAAVPVNMMRVPNRPMPMAPAAQYGNCYGGNCAPRAYGAATPCYDQPQVPNYAWPSYAAHPNYAAVTYPRQYSPTAWPFIGPFYPYPQVPLGWRKVTLEWDDGWWMLDFNDCR